MPTARRTVLRAPSAATTYWAATARVAHAAYRDVHRVLFSTAALDPGATAGAMQRADAGRAGGMAYLAQRLAEQDLLRPDVTVDDAAHILYLITSFDAFDQLYSGRGLPVDEVARLLVATAERAVCR
jgi:hypothetical protein